MKFKSALEETKESERWKSTPLFGSYEDYGMRMFEHLVLPNTVSLSVQGSYGHYCQPRKTLPVEEYTEMEVAIFLNNEWSSIEKVTNTEKLIHRFNAFSEGTVYAFVPVTLIEDLYQELSDQN